MKQTTLAVALESLDYTSPSCIDLINALVMQDSQRIDGLEEIHHRITQRQCITAKDINALEVLIPDVMARNHSLQVAGLCGISDEVTVIAALEAINWGKVGKWGIIAVIIGAIIKLITNLRKTYLSDQSKIKLDKLRDSFGHIASQLDDNQVHRLVKLQAALKKEGGITNNELELAFNNEKYLEVIELKKDKLDAFLGKKHPLKEYLKIPMESLAKPDRSDRIQGLTRLYEICFRNCLDESAQNAFVSFDSAFSSKEVSEKIKSELDSLSTGTDKLDDSSEHLMKTLVRWNDNIDRTDETTQDKMNDVLGNLGHILSGISHNKDGQGLLKSTTDSEGSIETSRLFKALNGSSIRRERYFDSNDSLTIKELFEKAATGENEYDKFSHVPQALGLLGQLDKGLSRTKVISDKVKKATDEIYKKMNIIEIEMKSLEMEIQKIKEISPDSSELVAMETRHDILSWCTYGRGDLDNIANSYANEYKELLGQIAGINLYISMAKRGMESYRTLTGKVNQFAEILFSTEV